MSVYSQAPVWLGYSGHPIWRPEGKQAVIVDLDATLMNNEHRQHLMQGEKKKWGQFFDLMRNDTVYPEIKMLTDLIFTHTDKAVLLVTGRPSHYHGMTLQSLHDNGVCFTALIMRAQHDNRADREVKFDMLEEIKRAGFLPILAIDDRPEVVNMWRQNGIRTLQADPAMWFQEDLGALDARALLDENERLKELTQAQQFLIDGEMKRLQELCAQQGRELMKMREAVR